MRLVLATHNRHKVTELRRILDGLDVEILSADDVALPDVEETGTTFEENALLKARAGAAATGLTCVADDSGLEIDALGGAPGVHSARYAGHHGDDAANLRLVLERLTGVDDRAGRFVCVAALVEPSGFEAVRHGVLEGTVITEARGAGGFGYDPIFRPEGDDRTTAEMTGAQKDAISHRGRAFRALRDVIAQRIAAPSSGPGSSRR